MDTHKNGYRSLFWPVMLIGVGALWLMGNLGLLNPNLLNMLAALWPLLLVGAGLDLLFARRSPVIGGLIALLLVGAAAFVLVSGASLGIQLPNAGEFKVEQFSAPLDGVQSATITLDTASQPVNVTALDDSDQLLDATIGHYGEMEFLVSGAANRQITLRRKPMTTFNFNMIPPQNARWEIGLAREVPLDLRVDSGSGSVAMDLTGLTLTALSLDSGSGSANLVLPAGADAYDVDVNSGSGAINIEVIEAGSLTLRVDSGSGSVNIDLPEGVAVRLEVQDGGSGAVRLPDALDRIQGDSDEDEGVWETDDYASATHKIEIILQDVGSGSVTVR